MKTLALKKNKNLKKARINFVRAFPFYTHINKGSKTDAFSFNVIISTYRELNPQTGMSVDLVTFNKIAEKILAQKSKTTSQNLENELSRRVQFLKSELKKNKTELVSVQFDECRGFSVLFENDEMIIIRRDFATDKNGDLFSVTSYLNKDQELKRVHLKNLKLGLEELILY